MGGCCKEEEVVQLHRRPAVVIFVMVESREEPRFLVHYFSLFLLSLTKLVEHKRSKYWVILFRGEKEHTFLPTPRQTVSEQPTLNGSTFRGHANEEDSMS